MYVMTNQNEKYVNYIPSYLMSKNLKNLNIWNLELKYLNF